MQVPASTDTPAARHVHIAQINLMRAVASLDSPIMAGFVELLAPIHALADRSAGFVWRLKSDDGMPTFADTHLLINYSIWQSIDDLWNFSYATQHLDLIRRRREWTSRITDSALAMWWVDAGSTPPLDEALHKIDVIREHGPTPSAFTFRQTFPPHQASFAGSPEQTASPATGIAKTGGEQGLGSGAEQAPDPAPTRVAAH